MKNFEKLDLKDCVVGGTVYCTVYSKNDGGTGDDLYDSETGKISGNNLRKA